MIHCLKLYINYSVWISHVRVFEVNVVRANMYRHGTHRSLTARRWQHILISLVSPVCVCVADYMKSLSQWRSHVAAAALWLVPEQTEGEERGHCLHGVHTEECLVPHHHAQQPQVQQCLKAQRGAEPPAIHTSRAITSHYGCDLSSIISHFSPHQCLWVWVHIAASPQNKKICTFLCEKENRFGPKNLALQLPCRINISTEFGVAYWLVCKGCVVQSM